MSNPYEQFIDWAGLQFGVNPAVLSSIAQRESSFNPSAQNNWDSNAAAGIPSYGLMQFIQPTFNSMYDSAMKERPKLLASLGAKDWHDWRQQAFVAAYGLASGAGSQWATYNDALADANGQLRVQAQHGGAIPGGGSPGGSVSIGMGSMPKIQGSAFDPVRAAKFQIGFADEPDLASAYINNMESDAVKYGNSVDARNQYQQQQPQTGAYGTGVGVPARRPGETGQQYLDRIAMSRFGLRHDAGNSQTTGGNHTSGSYHYRGGGQATDFGDAKNSWEDLNRWYSYVDENREALGIAELLNEGDHIHAATTRSRR